MQRETAIDVVLDVLENFHGNDCTEIFSKAVAYQHVFCYLFQIKILPRFPENKGAFLRCSTKVVV